MPKILIDNVSYEVQGGKNLLEAALELGLNLPYFCWHPALGSAGACRQCAVKQFANDQDTRGRVVMGCMTPATEGTRISIEDADAKEFRGAVVEYLMTSHPHDCPVCDEGGECHLQDMTVMTGHNYRNYRFQKRTHQNQDLGPLINHEMNRCITCYRCVRFYRDYAGGEDLQAFASKNHVYFGRSESGTLENEFSGNLVEVCPTGVFTDKTAKQHYTRRWDLTTAPSICGHCAVGCNTLPGERYGQLRRVRNRYHGEVNGYFLCDRGRYGYEYVNGPTRIKAAERRHQGESAPIARGEAAAEVGAWLREAPGLVVGVGSPRASLEDNFALRVLVGEAGFCAGVAERDLALIDLFRDCLRQGTAPAPTLRQIGEAEAVLILGEDVQQMAPMVALQIRQAARNQPFAKAAKIGIPAWNDLAVREVVQSDLGPIIVAAAGPTRLDDVASEKLVGAPEDLARFGFAVAAALAGDQPGETPFGDAASRVADTLKAAAKVVVVAGASLGSADLARAAAKVAWALRAAGREAYLALLPLEANSVGAGLLQGMPLEKALARLEAGEADTLVVLENDLYRRADRALVDRLFAAAKRVAVLDHTRSATTARAHVLLPASTFAEGDGTYVNYEGRAQRYYQVFVPEGEQLESWRLVRDIGRAAGRADLEWQRLDDVVDALEAALPALVRLEGVAPDARFRIEGLKIPRQSHRASGRTAIKADRNVSEGAVPVDVDSPLSFSMEGYAGAAPPALSAFQWAPGWNSPQSITRFQEEIGGPLRGGDPGVRLFEPAAVGSSPPSFEPPAAFAGRPGSVRVLPIQHIFGSDELSALAPGIAKLTPAPYLALSSAAAAELGLAAGSAVELLFDGEPIQLELKVLESFPAGCAGVPAGLAALPLPALPAWGTVLVSARGRAALGKEGA